MSNKSRLDSAIVLQQQGQYLAAANIYKALLKRKPKFFNACQLLAICYHKLGQHELSQLHFKKAIKLNTNHAACRNNFGNLQLDLGYLSQAKKQFEKAIMLKPDYPEAQSNLANCLQKQRQYQTAISHYLKAISLSPKEARYASNLGVAFTKTGQFDNAMTQLQTAHNLNPQLSSVYVHLVDLLMLMHLSDDAINIARNSIVEGMVHGAEKCAMHIEIAKLSWLAGDLITVQQHLAESKQIHQQFEQYDNTQNLRVYHGYLSKLLDLRLEDKNELCQTENTIVMISESHGLAPSGQVVRYQNQLHKIKSFLITGCKMWHLSQPKQNMYKQSFSLLFSKLPKKCHVILGFGEIDCRTDEGIYHHYLTKGIEYQRSIETMISGYFSNMLDAAKSYGHQLVFYGVPAPHPKKLDDLNEHQMSDFIKLIEIFNQQLKKQCQLNACPFLDVYELTRGQDGKSNLKWHIDNTHVHPKTLAKLF